MNPLERYLARRADLLRRPLVSGPAGAVRHTVTIPVLAESGWLFRTLDSLADNPEPWREQTLIVCVVNNRRPGEAPTEWIEDNRRVLERLDAAVCQPGRLRLAYVDAASPGCELDPGQGVGTARKLGMDHALAVLLRNSVDNGVLFSLDADTLVEPNYLEAGVHALAAKDGWGAVFDYAHPLDGPEDHAAAIVCYELYLRYHVLGLRYAGSPYAYPAIGSAMACRAEAYAAVSGMNQRLGGEDFYFLQELAKTGRIAHIRGTTVHPSARPSDRVPFGTGPRVRRFIQGGHPEYRLYHPQSYRVLREWLHAAESGVETTAEVLLHKAGAISPALRGFLDANNFAGVWPRLQQHSPGADALRRQFHRWFDGLKTLRLIHTLRDNGLPDLGMFQAIEMLLKQAELPEPNTHSHELNSNVREQAKLLIHLRDLSKTQFA